MKIALKPWFDEDGHLKGTSRLGFLGKRFEALLDRLVGLGLLRDMAEFFQAFGPLYDGFRERAVQVQKLLRAPETLFVLVSAPGEERIADTMFFARRLEEAGYKLGPVIVNRVHPQVDGRSPIAHQHGAAGRAHRLLHWLGERDSHGLDELRSLLPGHHLTWIPLMPVAPTDLASLELLGTSLLQTEPAKP